MNQYILATSSILPLETWSALWVSLRRDNMFWEEQDGVRQMPKLEFWVRRFCQSEFCFGSTFQQISLRRVVRDTKVRSNCRRTIECKPDAQLQWFCHRVLVRWPISAGRVLREAKV
ncbi:hypothetical protein SRHO_G00256350 [Serrasalmus rhombeus]